MSSLAAGNDSYRKSVVVSNTRNLNTLYGISLTNQTGTVENNESKPSSSIILVTTATMLLA